MKPFLIQDLVCVGRKCALLQHQQRNWRVYILESLVGRLEYRVGKLGEGFLPLLVNMDEWGWASVLMWISLIFRRALCYGISALVP